MNRITEPSAPRERLHNDVLKKSNELLVHMDEFLNYAIRELPRVIMPVFYGVNEFGFKYISYIDEDDTDINGELQTIPSPIMLGRGQQVPHEYAQSPQSW